MKISIIYKTSLIAMTKIKSPGTRRISGYFIKAAIISKFMTKTSGEINNITYAKLTLYSSEFRQPH